MGSGDVFLLFVCICGAIPQMRTMKALNYSAHLRMCVMQKMLSTAWTESGFVAGRLRSSLPRGTEKVSKIFQNLIRI